MSPERASSVSELSIVGSRSFCSFSNGLKTIKKNKKLLLKKGAFIERIELGHSLGF
jgi:hypothetical protein